MTAKEKYISAYLDGYFSDKEFKQYGIEYISALNIGTERAENNWKMFKRVKVLRKKITQGILQDKNY